MLKDPALGIGRAPHADLQKELDTINDEIPVLEQYLEILQATLADKRAQQESIESYLLTSVETNSHGDRLGQDKGKGKAVVTDYGQDFEWSRQLSTKLKEVFHHDRFRLVQEP